MIRKVVLGSISVLMAGAFAAASAQMPQQTQATKIDVQKGQQLATQVCAACHGADGNSNVAANPKLAGQHADYLAKQLYDFKTRPNGKALRQNPVMTGFATPLTDEDIRNVSAFYATQKLKPAFATDKEAAELGQKIYRAGIADKNVPSCAACHGPAGAGIPVQFPRLSGQFGAYIEAQMHAFRSGTRGNSAQMSQIANRMSDAEIKAVSDYIAGLR